ncbi:MAG: sensor histidine kinase [Nitrospiraceae bacterium]
MKLSIFWRLTIGFLAIIAVVTAVNLFALYQIREITESSTELVSKRYPAIESGKWLIANLYAQERSEKKYLAVRDDVFLKNFDEEAKEFRRTLTALQDQQSSSEAKNLLKEAEGFHDEYRILFQSEVRLQTAQGRSSRADYTGRRNAFVDRTTESLQAFVNFHQGMVNALVGDSRRRSEQAAAITKQLVVVAILLGLGLAALATYSILVPLRRLQEHIREIGFGNFRTPVEVEAPSDLRELVESVRSMAKKLQELDHLKAGFVSHMTNELRSPLTALHAGTQLLLEEIPGPVTQDQRETLHLMTESSRQLIDMISILLDLSKMEAGMLEYRMAATDLKRVVDTSVNKIRLLADRERIRIIIEAPKGPALVPADDARIQQVLDSLLSNAIKFSREGATIQIRLEPDFKSGVMRTSVTDTGGGISTDSLPHIFERFYRGSTQTRRSFIGSGIGLTLAKMVVEAHGGKIWAESELGKGTTMNFILPMA